MNTKRTIEQTGILKNVRKALVQTQPDIDQAIFQIWSNWSKERSRSRQNWRLKQIHLSENSGYETDPKWKDSEVRLERTLLSAWGKQPGLWNQMPVASGLLPLPDKDTEGRRRVSSEGRRAVDLIYRPEGADGPIEFLELKVRRSDDSWDSVRDAALELLEYGVLYLFSRKHRKGLGYDMPTRDNTYEVLGAPHIRLRVLAPLNYYADQNITSFSVDAANRALKDYIQKSGEFDQLKMDIGFEQLASVEDVLSRLVNKTPWTGGKGN